MATKTNPDLTMTEAEANAIVGDALAEAEQAARAVDLHARIRRDA